MKDQMDNKKSPWFTRILIVGFSILIVLLIVFSFFVFKPHGEITAPLITLLLILLIVSLSETFDNFSLCKLITLSKNISKKENQVIELKKENNELRNQVINIATNINQNQNSTNIVALSDDLIKKMTVQKASPEEVSEKDSEETEENLIYHKTRRKRINRKRCEELTFSKISEQLGFSSLNVIRDAKMVTEFHGIDPISDYHPIYDGYINDGKSEIFVEIRPRGSYIFFDERLYMFLTKINYYRTIKKANTYLLLVLVEVADDEVSNKKRDRTEMLLKKFEPAIASGILKIKDISLSVEESASVIDTK